MQWAAMFPVLLNEDKITIEGIIMVSAGILDANKTIYPG
jgi:hypothetical protein